MNTQHSDLLEKNLANRQMVNELYSHGFIDRQGREHALDVLYPRNQWAKWSCYILAIIGSSLVLAGIIFFFAFNWMALSATFKFALVQTAIVACLILTVLLKLDRLGGKISLLSASVLVGVFLAVFGQIYQTGADAYQLFLYWGILISGWVAISRFAPLFFVWIIIWNVALSLFWDQTNSNELSFCIVIALLNSGFLFACELFAHFGQKWLDVKWLKITLVLAVLTLLLIPTIAFIADGYRRNYELLGTILNIAALCTIFGWYRFGNKSMWGVAPTILSVCIIIITIMGRIVFKERSDALQFLFMGVFTLVVFAGAVVALRKIASQMEKNHGK